MNFVSRGHLKILSIILIYFSSFIPLASMDTPAIEHVSVSKDVFNPSKGETVDIIFSLTKEAEVTIKIYDADFNLVSYLIHQKKFKAGAVRINWDGKDDADIFVPDEAYFFTIEAFDGKRNTIYDPASFSGGEDVYVETVNFDREMGSLSYVLKKPARVLIRTGIKNGPLMRTLIDWKSQPAGENVVYWNGFDDTGKIDITRLHDFSMTASGFLLPKNSIITYGNKEYDFVEYSENRKILERKGKKYRYKQRSVLSRHYFMDRILDRTPEVTITFPTLKRKPEQLELTGRVIVNVDLNERDKKCFTPKQFEIIFSIDGQYYAEETNGYVPYNWVWDTTQFPDGEHFLTVNIASLDDQIGASSVKLFINNKTE